MHPKRDHPRSGNVGDLESGALVAGAHDREGGGMMAYLGVAVAMVLSTSPANAAPQRSRGTEDSLTPSHLRLGRRAQYGQCFGRRLSAFRPRVVKTVRKVVRGVSKRAAASTGGVPVSTGSVLPGFAQYVQRGRFLDGARRWITEVAARFSKERPHLRWRFTGLQTALQRLLQSAQRRGTMSNNRRHGFGGFSGPPRLTEQQRTAAFEIANQIGALLGVPPQGTGTSGPGKVVLGGGNPRADAQRLLEQLSSLSGRVAPGKRRQVGVLRDQLRNLLNRASMGSSGGWGGRHRQQPRFDTQAFNRIRAQVEALLPPPKAAPKPPPPPPTEALVAARRKELARNPCFPLYVLESGGNHGSQLVEVSPAGDKRVLFSGLEGPQGVINDPRSGNLFIVERPRSSGPSQPSQERGRLLEVDPARGEVTSFQDVQSLPGLHWVDDSGTLYGIGPRGKLWLRPPGEPKFESLPMSNVRAARRVGDYLYLWAGMPGNAQLYRLDPADGRQESIVRSNGSGEGLAALKGALYLSHNGQIWKIEGLAPAEHASMKPFASLPKGMWPTTLLSCGEKLYVLGRRLNGNFPYSLWTVDQTAKVSQVPKVSLTSPKGVAFYRGGKRALVDFAALAKKQGESAAAAEWVKRLAGRASQLGPEEREQLDEIKIKLELIEKLRAIKTQLGVK